MTRVYVDLVGDLFHAGHVRLLQEAARHGDHVIAGVLSDETVAAYKRRPVMTLAERVAVVEACRHVDDLTSEAADEVYGPAVERGILRLVPRTGGISTTELIRRVREHR